VLTAVAAGLGLLGLSVFYAGWQNHVEYATHLLPALSHGYATMTNQSYNGLFNRLLPGAPDIAAFTPAPDRTSVRILWALAATATYGLAVVAVRRLPPSKIGPEWVFGFAFLVATIVSPIAWEHHYASTVFVFAAAYRLYRDDQEWTPPAPLLVPLAAAFITICGYFEVRELHGAVPQILASYVLFGALTLAATYAAMLRALAEGPLALSTRART
jgi:alpha-1,2-mannosyltransferase